MKPCNVAEAGLDEATDQAVWAWGIQRQHVVVSKDEDFFFLANRTNDLGSLLWIRLGNCRKGTLIAAFDRCLESVLAAFESGQRIVELG